MKLPQELLYYTYSERKEWDNHIIFSRLEMSRNDQEWTRNDYNHVLMIQSTSSMSAIFSDEILVIFGATEW